MLRVLALKVREFIFPSPYVFLRHLEGFYGLTGMIVVVSIRFVAKGWDRKTIDRQKFSLKGYFNNAGFSANAGNFE